MKQNFQHKHYNINKRNKICIEIAINTQLKKIDRTTNAIKD